MGKATQNWDSVETWQRLVAAMIAAGCKPDLRETARHFDTTYDTLENRFRKLKKDAAALREEVATGKRDGPATPSRAKSTAGTPRKPKTPVKSPLETVTNGRVTKTPIKKNDIKQEQLAHQDSVDTSMSLAVESTECFNELFAVDGSDFFARHDAGNDDAFGL